jgi:hypothetical protein
MTRQWVETLLGVAAKFMHPRDGRTSNMAVHTSFLTPDTFAVVVHIYAKLVVSRVRLRSE